MTDSVDKGKKLTILLTGGCGYIGSHILVELCEMGMHCVIVDNLSNSSEESIKRCEIITGIPCDFFKIDLLNYQGLLSVFKLYDVYAVIHLAGLKAVGESVKKPLKYYENNVMGSINLLKAMSECGVSRIIFSSSATVYGTPVFLPITESHQVGKCSNPYGNTKYVIEELINDYMKATNGSYIHLRYFNPVGAHESGTIGESPKDIPNNLFPYVSQVAIGSLPILNVFGDDYETPDGTGVRDYIHVVDLAKGHTAAVKYLIEQGKTVQTVINLGTGKGYSVLEIVNAFEKACGKKIPYKIIGRREGDVACVYADISLAEERLKWIPQFDLARMCEDSWRWQTKNPEGYS